MTAHARVAVEPETKSVVELVDSIWGVYHPSFVVIRTEEREHEDHPERIVVPFGDLCARDYILRLLRTRYGSTSIEEVYALDFCRAPAQYADRHLVFICGPEGSVATRLALERLGLLNLFVGYSIRSLFQENRVYGAPPRATIKKESLVVEYDKPQLATPGLFLKTLSPFAAQGKRVYCFIVAGSRTFGTQAAAAITCSVEGLTTIGQYIGGQAPPLLRDCKFWDGTCCALVCLMDRADGGPIKTNQGNRTCLLEPEKSNPFTNPGQIEETMQALEATMPIFQSAQLREGISGVLKTLAETSSSAKAHFESIGNRIDRLSDDVRQYLKIVLPAVALVAALVMGAFYFYLQTMRDWLKSDLNAIAKMNEAKIESLYSRIDQRLAELNAKQDTEISTLKAIAESLKGTPVRPSGPRRADDSPEPAK